MVKAALFTFTSPQIKALISMMNAPSGWVRKKFFHSRLPKMVLLLYIYLIFFTYLSHQKTSNFHLKLEDVYKKQLYQRTVEKIIWIYSKLNYVEFRIDAEKGDLCFCKIYTNQTFTPISSKIIYFKKHLAHEI